VLERGKITKGTGSVYKTVEVEFCYDSKNDHYGEKAIVRDESLYGSHSTYRVSSPLIKTEERALKVAEAILANLTMRPESVAEGVPSTVYTIVSFDTTLDDLKTVLTAWLKLWK